MLRDFVQHLLLQTSPMGKDIIKIGIVKRKKVKTEEKAVYKLKDFQKLL